MDLGGLSRGLFEVCLFEPQQGINDRGQGGAGADNESNLAGATGTANRGDGGSGGDPQNYSQNTESLLGKMLRINVNSGAYSIPENNPYGDEIWSIGLRNPWKFSFDSLNGDLWIADVGQNEYEEINMVQNNPANINYGWRCYEGNEPYNLSGCPEEGLTFPVSTYSHYSSGDFKCCLLYTSPSPRDRIASRMPSSA